MISHNHLKCLFFPTFRLIRILLYSFIITEQGPCEEGPVQRNDSVGMPMVISKNGPKGREPPPPFAKKAVKNEANSKFASKYSERSTDLDR